MASLGKYTLVRKLAAGGMAEVFLARTEGPAGFSKTLVIKRILPHLAEDADFVTMFLNEARLAALLNHQNLVQIFELGREGDTYFIAMEWVDGTNLRSLLRAARTDGITLPFAVVLKIVSLVCDGLAYAHELTDDRGKPLGLIHRDISPDNLLLSRQGNVKVADFGIAKAANAPSITRRGILKGKIPYMPPELIDGPGVDRRGDVFSLGVVLHEALTHSRPFAGSNDLETMNAVLTSPPPRLPPERGLPAELQRIVDRALAKKPDQRYPDCRSLQVDLERLLVSEGQAVGPHEVGALVERYFPRTPGDSQAVLDAARESEEARTDRERPLPATRALPAPEPEAAVSRRPLVKPVVSRPPVPAIRRAPAGEPVSGPSDVNQPTERDLRADRVPSADPPPPTLPDPNRTVKLDDTPPVWSLWLSEALKSPGLLAMGFVVAVVSVLLVWAWAR